MVNYELFHYFSNNLSIYFGSRPTIIFFNEFVTQFYIVLVLLVLLVILNIGIFLKKDINYCIFNTLNLFVDNIRSLFIKCNLLVNYYLINSINESITSLDSLNSLDSNTKKLLVKLEPLNKLYKKLLESLLNIASLIILELKNINQLCLKLLGINKINNEVANKYNKPSLHIHLMSSFQSQNNCYSFNVNYKPRNEYIKVRPMKKISYSLNNYNKSIKLLILNIIIIGFLFLFKLTCVNSFPITAEWNNKIYEAYKMTPFDSINCNRGELVKVITEEENNFLKNTFASKNFWLASKFNRTNLNNLEDVKWINNIEMNYNNWNINEPETICASMIKKGKWKSTNCDEEKLYVCKQPINESTKVIEYNNYFYEFYPLPSKWNETYCRDNGRLLWIENENENEIITELIQELGPIWLGLQFEYNLSAENFPTQYIVNITCPEFTPQENCTCLENATLPIICNCTGNSTDLQNCTCLLNNATLSLICNCSDLENCTCPDNSTLTQNCSCTEEYSTLNCTCFVNYTLSNNCSCFDNSTLYDICVNSSYVHNLTIPYYPINSTLQFFPHSFHWWNGNELLFQNWIYPNATHFGWTFLNLTYSDLGELGNYSMLCVSMDNEGKWNIRNCSDVNHYVCKRPKDDMIYIENENFVYTMKNIKSSWNNINCTDYGGIVTIMNQEENNLILNDFFDQEIWLGLNLSFINTPSTNDINWYNGLVAEYQNWRSGDPFIFGNVLCVYMNYDGTWNIENCTKSLHYICKYDKPVITTTAYYNGYKYELIPTPSPFSSSACNGKGNLIWIENQQENDFILQTFNYNYFLGITYVQFSNAIWLNGNAIDYSNWLFPISQGMNISCVYMNSNGNWATGICTSISKSFLCKKSIMCNGIAYDNPNVCNSLGSCINEVCVCGDGTYCNSTGYGGVCPNGTWSEILASEISDCYTCPSLYGCSNRNKIDCTQANYYYITEDEGQSSCNECKAGFYIDTYYDRTCLSCPMGKACPGDGTWKNCIGNEYSSNEMESNCSICPQSYYVTDDHFFCIECAKDEFCPGNGELIFCLEGYATTEGCNPCPEFSVCEFGMIFNCTPGNYVTELDQKCLPCPIGSSCSGSGPPQQCKNQYFSDLPGMIQCLRCEGGHYSDGRGLYCRSCLSEGVCINGIDILICQEGEYYDENTNDCLICPIGFFCANSLRFVCPNGYYGNDTGLTECLACPAGTFLINTIGTSLDDCTLCPIGTYSTDSASVSCIKCPIGYYGEFPGASKEEECVPCLPGKYYDLENSTCYNCSAGMFNPYYANTFCQYCGVGNYSDEGASECSLCPAGSFSDIEGASECNYCPPGTFNPVSGSNSSDDCIKCETGGSFKFGATNENVCESCSPGFKKIDSLCELCPPGTYSNISDALICNKCPGGYYNDQTGKTSINDCKPCDKGWYSFEGAIECTPCPPGEFNNEFASSKVCSICPEGKYSESNSSYCKICPLGTYSLEGYGSCNLCPKGSFTNSTESNYCLLCDTGAYLNYEGGDQCILCPPGTYNDKFGAQSEDDCIKCPKGTYSSTVSVRDISRCIPCPSGTFCNYEGMSKPNSCPKGTYSTLIGSKSIDNCINCPKGTYSDIQGIVSETACKSCPTGHYSSTLGAANIDECIPCPLGTYTKIDRPTNETDCIPCEAGSYSSKPGESCIPCPRGTYNEKQQSFDYRDCIECELPKITASTGSKNYSDCFECPEGYYVSQFYTCDPCPVGTYFNTSKPYTDLPSPKDCIPCGEGYYQPLLAQISPQACIPCASGMYGPFTNNKECIPCGAGRYSLNLGGKQLDSCDLCPPGTWSDVIIANTSEVCLVCAPGLFNNQSGGNSKYSCELCPPGTKSEFEGSTYCESCDDMHCQFFGSSYNLSQKSLEEVTAYRDPSAFFSIIETDYDNIRLALPLSALGVILLLIIILIFIFLIRFRTQVNKVLKIFDCGFSMKSKPHPNHPQKNHPTSFGGILSVVVILGYISVVAFLFVDFIWNNKIVIDSVTLTQTEQIPGNFFFEATLTGRHQMCNASYELSGFIQNTNTNWTCSPGEHIFNASIIEGCQCKFECINCQPFGNRHDILMSFEGDIMTPVILFKVGVSHFVAGEVYIMEGSLVANGVMYTGDKLAHTLSFNLNNVKYYTISNLNAIYEAIGLTVIEKEMQGYSVQLTSKIPGSATQLDNFLIQKGMKVYFELEPVVGAQISTEVTRQNLFMFFAQIITLSSVFLTVGAIIFFIYSTIKSYLFYFINLIKKKIQPKKTIIMYNGKVIKTQNKSKKRTQKKPILTPIKPFKSEEQFSPSKSSKSSKSSKPVKSTKSINHIKSVKPIKPEAAKIKTSQLFNPSSPSNTIQSIKPTEKTAKPNINIVPIKDINTDITKPIDDSNVINIKDKNSKVIKFKLAKPILKGDSKIIRVKIGNSQETKIIKIKSRKKSEDLMTKIVP